MKISLIDVIHALRPRHWVKNLFVFLPLLFAGLLFSYPANLLVLAGFCIFCLISSAGYLVNDIVDLKLDALHPLKKNRPIIAGKITRAHALGLALFLCVSAFIVSWIVSWQLFYVVAGYSLLNYLYSKFLKKVVIIDVFCIGAFFLLRVLAGSLLAGAVVSHWIILMTVLVALFLGFIKRRQELVLFPDAFASTREVLHQYRVGFIDQMVSVITSSIVVVYTLYSVDAMTIGHIGSNHLLFTVPFVYYGIFRYLYLIHSDSIDGDPTNVLFADKIQQVNLLLWVGVCAGVIYLKW